MWLWRLAATAYPLVHDMILFIAPREEPNLQRLFAACEWSGLRYIHLDTRERPRLTRYMGAAGESLKINGRWLDPDSITGVWSRGLGLTRPVGMATAEQLIHAEWTTFLTGMEGWARAARWANSLGALASSSNKLNQLELAASIGFKVPRSIVTDDPMEAKAFLEREREVVIKRLSAGNPSENADRILFTKKLVASDEKLFDAIGPCPVFLQSLVPKEIELRAIVMGDRVFTAGFAASAHEATSVDTRHWVSTDDSYFSFELDRSIADMAVAMTRSLGLTYGALDLIIDGDGQVTFLELNNAGQWGWIEAATGFPITEVIVQELLRGK